MTKARPPGHTTVVDLLMATDFSPPARRCVLGVRMSAGSGESAPPPPSLGPSPRRPCPAQRSLGPAPAEAEARAHGRRPLPPSPELRGLARWESRVSLLGLRWESLP